MSLAVEPERLEDRLARLEDERSHADRVYNERLTAVDQALAAAPAVPHAPPPYDESKITPINEAWQLLPDGPPATDRTLKGRLRGFIWRLVGPPIERQQAFNAVLVDHLNRNVSAHREAANAIAAAIEVLRTQAEAAARFQATLMQLLQSLTLYVDTKDRSVGGHIQVLNAAIGALADDWMKHWESQRVREDRFEAQHPALLRAYEDLSQKVSLAQQTSLLLKREVERLLRDHAEPAVTAPAGDTGRIDAPTAPSASSTLDSFKYVGFEDRFRGAESEIRARLADYVPLLAGAESVVDIGCGRGELLDLLRSAGISAHGIDTNAAMIEVCHERGLSATAGDALAYLDAQADNSLGGVIAIQVVEHLEPDYLSRMIESAFHKLAPGAPLIFETINPACWVAFFESYLRDVTHRWPLHPETLQYLVQAGGFSSVSIQYRAPVADSDRLQHVPLLPPREGREHNPVLVDLVDIVNSHADKLNARLFTFMDYAVVARK